MYTCLLPLLPYQGALCCEPAALRRHNSTGSSRSGRRITELYKRCTRVKTNAIATRPTHQLFHTTRHAFTESLSLSLPPSLPPSPSLSPRAHPTDVLFRPPAVQAHSHTHTRSPARFVCLFAPPPPRGPPPYGAHQKIAEPEAVADPVSAFSTRSASLSFDARPLHSFSVVPSLNKGAASQASWRAPSREGLLSRAHERMARALLFAWNQTSVSRPPRTSQNSQSPPRRGQTKRSKRKRETPRPLST
jgi:hypothetical protein